MGDAFVHMDVSAVIALMANTSLADEFVGLDAPGRVRAAQRWMDAECDIGTIDETVDVVRGGEETSACFFLRF